MNIRRRFAVLAAGCVVLGSAQAVSVNARGQGQVLIYPYYNVAAGNTTLVTLTNHSAQAKAILLRVADGENGRSAASINVYLSPGDSWTATLFDRGGSEAPGLLTQDSSCTFPFDNSLALPQLPDGRRYLPLGFEVDDAGSLGVERLREGYIEAVEMATIRPDTATFAAISRNASGARDCGTIAAAWEAHSGYWLAEPLRDLANPTGGLSGEAAIVNVAAGTIFGAAAIALEDFRVDPQDQPRGSSASVAMNGVFAPGSGSLLVHALSNPQAGTAIADLIADGRALKATYPAPSRAIDAVSAVLSAAQLAAAFDTTPALGATSSFVLTYPTRAFYVDPAVSGQPVALEPFDALFAGAVPLQHSVGRAFQLRNREGMIVSRSVPAEGCSAGCAQSPLLRSTETAVEVIAPGGVADVLLDSHLHGDIGASSGSRLPIPQRGSGWLLIDLEQARGGGIAPALRASLEGYRLRGLPVLGTRFISYINAEANPGVLANYSSAGPMSSVAHCVNSQNQACAAATP